MDTFVVVEWPECQKYMEHPYAEPLMSDSDWLVPFGEIAKDLNLPELKLTWDKLGSHIHAKIYIRQPPTETWALAGRFTVSEKEWPGIQERLGSAGVIFQHKPESI